jgi:hypothetical protein
MILKHAGGMFHLLIIEATSGDPSIRYFDTLRRSYSIATQDERNE